MENNNQKKTGKNTLISIILCVISPIVVIIAKSLIFSQYHGIAGFLTYEPITHSIFIFLYPISIITPILYLFGNFANYKHQSSKKIKVNKKISVYFLIFNIIVPILFLFSSFTVPSQSNDKAPQLWLSSNQGVNGLPDVGVSFWTEDKVISEIMWGEGGLINTKLIDNVAKNSHVFMLEDLKQSTDYGFKYNGIIYNFTTLNITDGFKFAIVSDSHFNENTTENSIMINHLDNVINNNNVLLIHTGDLVNFGWVDAEWANALSVMSNYTTQIPSRVLIGNHDGGLNGNSLHESYCKPEALDETTTPWQKIDFGDDIHFIMLSLEWSAYSDLGDAQLSWLNTTLSAIDPDDWTIIFSHAPFHSSSIDTHIVNDDLLTAVEPIFIENDVDLVFTGHNHIFEHLDASNVDYFQVSRIGKKTYEYDELSIYSQEIINQPGFVEVTINGNDAEVSFINSTNEVVYTVTIQK